MVGEIVFRINLRTPGNLLALLQGLEGVGVVTYQVSSHVPWLRTEPWRSIPTPGVCEVEFIVVLQFQDPVEDCFDQ